MTELRITPSTATQPCTAAGKLVNWRSASAQPKPIITPIAAAEHALQHAFREELAQDIRLRRPHGAPHADLLGALRNATSITFMMTMPPTTAEMELIMTKTAKKAELMLFQSDM